MWGPPRPLGPPRPGLEDGHGHELSKTLGPTCQGLSLHRDLCLSWNLHFYHRRDLHSVLYRNLDLNVDPDLHWHLDLGVHRVLDLNFDFDCHLCLDLDFLDQIGRIFPSLAGTSGTRTLTMTSLISSSLELRTTFL